MNKFFVHAQGLCESTHIGQDTRIWAFTHIMPNAVIGSNCNICDYVFIENEVLIGNNVTIKSGVQIWDGLVIEDDVFIGPNVTFTNDLFPRSKDYSAAFEKTIIRKKASIGANATILPGIEIGEMSMIGAGAVVTKSVPPKAVVVGNPARIIRYIGEQYSSSPSLLLPEKYDWKDSTSQSLVISNKTQHVAIYRLPSFSGMQGKVNPIEFTQDLPFVPKRQFFVSDFDNNKVRREYAYKECHQFLFALNGSLNIVVDDGAKSLEIHLDSPKFGLYIPPHIWSRQYQFSPDAILAIYASHSYHSEAYIRDYSQFMQVVN